ncbi:hypothetical protein HAX54_032973 [Datura stramonium]|uniref:Uncharacterized protein n=1 Tax=Datura stramonium TaxID=4076 RepID=A0ABS8VE82_DATST|nr:hypothetical protein [Datura stramonium]
MAIATIVVSEALQSAVAHLLQQLAIRFHRKAIECPEWAKTRFTCYAIRMLVLFQLPNSSPILIYEEFLIQFFLRKTARLGQIRKPQQSKRRIWHQAGRDLHRFVEYRPAA